MMAIEEPPVLSSDEGCDEDNLVDSEFGCDSEHLSDNDFNEDANSDVEIIKTPIETGSLIPRMVKKVATITSASTSDGAPITGKKISKVRFNIIYLHIY
jgi:hypothetical protein